jgi:hypothetical protein
MKARQILEMSASLDPAEQKVANDFKEGERREN